MERQNMKDIDEMLELIKEKEKELLEMKALGYGHTPSSNLPFRFYF